MLICFRKNILIEKNRQVDECFFMNKKFDKVLRNENKKSFKVAEVK
jgi:hypothetical protein